MDELEYRHWDCFRGLGFTIKFELSDNEKVVSIEENYRDRSEYAYDELLGCYGYVSRSGPIVKREDIRTDKFKETNYYIRAKGMYDELLNAWINYRHANSIPS